MKLRVFLIAALAPVIVFASDSKSDAVKRIDESAKVFNEIMGAPDKGIPQELLDKAQCIGIIPGLKRAGFIIGGKYGKGVLTCRTGTGWSAPSVVKVEGGSVGAQIGAGETDVVFIVMNKGGEDKLMQDKFTVGADAAAMAGPVGRSGAAETDAMMHAEILSYSRSRGVFAGVTLGGSTLRPDTSENEALYGSGVNQRQILTGGVKTPAFARPLYTAITSHTGVKKGTGD